jgi:hypothetical protein
VNVSEGRNVKRTVSALIAGLVLGGTGVGIAATQTRFVTVKPGTYITFQGLDLYCAYLSSDPDHNDPGPLLDCGRSSVRGGGRLTSMTRYHFGITNEAGTNYIIRVPRSP